MKYNSIIIAVMLSCLQVVQDLNVDVFIQEIRNITLLNVTTFENGRQLEPGKSQRYALYLSTGPRFTRVCISMWYFMHQSCLCAVH
jgi:hypothetical protein